MMDKLISKAVPEDKQGLVEAFLDLQKTGRLDLEKLEDDLDPESFVELLNGILDDYDQLLELSDESSGSQRFEYERVKTLFKGKELSEAFVILLDRFHKESNKIRKAFVREMAETEEERAEMIDRIE